MAVSSETATFHNRDQNSIDRLEELLQKILGGIPPHEVEGLDLDAAYLADLGIPVVEKIAGLEPFDALQELSLAGHNLQSWQGMPALGELRKLDFSSNQIDTFEHAPDLPRLEVMDLSLNLLQDLDFLPPWHSLHTLNLGHNGLRSVAGLQGRKLRSLTLSGNRAITDLSPLAELPDLRICFANGLLVADFSWIGNTSLEQFTFRPTSANRIESLYLCPSLTHLTMNLSRCTGTVELPYLPNLQHLSLTKGKQVDHILLPECPALQALSITFSGIEQLPDLSGFSRLRHLDIRFNQLGSLPDLSSFSSLSDVLLEGNPLSPDVHRQMADRPDIQWRW